jgi:uncharacterized membrane protein
MVTKTALNTLLASAVVLTLAGAATQGHAEDAANEKCYGVVKAAMNDCASATKSHTCAGHAATDASGDEWVNVPKGLCEKLAGGSLEPKAAAAEAAPADAH